MAKTLLLAALMAQSLAGALPAQETTPSVHVRYADLDLNSPQGRSALDRRLRRAAEAVCPNDNGVRDLSRLVAIQQCRDEKLAELAPARSQALAAAQRRFPAGVATR